MGADFIATGLWRRGSIQITDAEAEATRERIRALTATEIAKNLSMLWESYEDDPYGMLDLDAEREFDPKAEAETIADAIRKTLEGDFDWLFDVALKGGDRGVTTMQVGPYEVLVMGEMSSGDIGDEQEGLGRLADSGVLERIGFFQDEPDRLTRVEEAVVTDTESMVLDELKLRAGLIWACPDDAGWRNPEGEPCEQCGKRQEDFPR